MNRKTYYIVILVMILVVSLDVIWAILNYVLPVIFFGWIEISPIIPGGAVTDWLILFYLLPVLAIPFYLLMAVVTPRWLVLPLNRILNPGSETYYYGVPTTKPKPLYNVFRRAIFALLLTFGLSLTVATYIGPLFIIWNPSLPLAVNTWNTAAVIFPIAFIALGVILPSSWLIDDTNILFHSQPPSGSQELFSAGRVLTYLLAGYAGISVLIFYGYIIIDIGIIYATTIVTPPWPWVPPWFVVLITLLNPFIFIYMPLLMLLAYDRYLPSLMKRLKTYMDSRGTQQLSTMCVVDVDITEFLGVGEAKEELGRATSKEPEEEDEFK
ncbi:MAG: hypothetical protein ACFE9D_00860 [Promethearchaeota archaeon]